LQLPAVSSALKKARLSRQDSGETRRGPHVFRTIILIVFIYLCFKAVKDVIIKPLLKQYRESYRPAAGNNPVRAIDEMVQDPVCRVYIQKSTALSATVSGEAHYFCSSECMMKFKEKS
jgi:YHS domain-containing protein